MGSHSPEPPSMLRAGRIPRPARSPRPAGASALAASPMCTSLMRRRKCRDVEPGGEPRGPAGRQRVVGAGDVVAERRGARRRRRTGSPRERTCGASASAAAPDQLEVLGRERLGERERRAASGTPTSAIAAPLSGASASCAATSSSSAGVVADGDRERPVAVLGLGQQVDRDQRRVGARGRDARSRRSGPAKPSMPTPPETSRLASWTQRLPGPGDHVDARDRLGAVGERGDRVRPADAVDLVDAAERAGREDHRVPAGRADDDLVDAGRLRGDRAHDDAARVRARARRGRRSPRGAPASRAAARPGPAGARRRRPRRRPARATAPTFAIASSSPARTAGSSAVERVLQLGGASTRSGPLDAVQARSRSRPARRRRRRARAATIAATSSLDRRRRGHQRADLRRELRRGRGVVQPQAGASRHAAPRRSRRPRRP